MVSVFVKFLAALFCCEIGVQVGNGRVNCISGCMAKDHDAVDVGLGEYVRKDTMVPWLATYRLLCTSSPCIPEVAIRLAGVSEFERSCTQVLLYPPQPEAMQIFDDRQKSFSSKMYGQYLQVMRDDTNDGNVISQSFLKWHRSREWDVSCEQVKLRVSTKKTNVVACRYWYELTDGFWGQFGLTQLPHAHVKDLLPSSSSKYLRTMLNFCGLLEYLQGWRWQAPGCVTVASGVKFDVKALALALELALAVAVALA